MYSITTTSGLIIKSQPLGESGKFFSIFTRDLGLILASAQGIRLEKSKLRFHSQEYSFGEFSFVRGKEYWRLTNANQMRSDLQIWKSDLTVRMVLLLRRLLHGEEAHPELFDHIEKSFNFLGQSNDLSVAQLKTAESVVVFRILHLLGYIGVDKKLNSKIISEGLNVELLDEVGSQRISINAHINKALRESHL